MTIRYKNQISQCNQRWAAEVLNMKDNGGRGPDLVDDGKILELKFKYSDEDRLKRIKTKTLRLHWIIRENQLKYEENNSIDRFWGMGIYFLNTPISELNENTELDGLDLENFVSYRELYIVDWCWKDFFSEKRKVQLPKKFRGNRIRYLPRHSDIPKVKKIFRVNKGLVNLTEGVTEFDFNVSGVDISPPNTPF